MVYYEPRVTQADKDNITQAILATWTSAMIIVLYIYQSVIGPMTPSA